MKKYLFKALGGGELLEDLLRYEHLTGLNVINIFLRYPEFRYLMLYRMRRKNMFFNFVLLPLKFFNSHNLYITCLEIEGGLFIQHGFSTVIACRHMGKNCWINQQVTIGYSDKIHTPYIGNNVTINAGAKVIGGITIGNDVVIGANAVVVKDVPDHSIVVGVPAKIIKRRSSMDEDWKRV